jgi:hypothetical protein
MPNEPAEAAVRGGYKGSVRPADSDEIRHCVERCRRAIAAAKFFLGLGVPAAEVRRQDMA